MACEEDVSGDGGARISNPSPSLYKINNNTAKNREN